jgi:hypothetical protein
LQSVLGYDATLKIDILGVTGLILPFSNIFVSGRGELDVESSLSDGDEVVSGVVVMCASFNGCVRVLDLTKFFDAFRCVGNFLSFSDHFGVFEVLFSIFGSCFLSNIHERG